MSERCTTGGARMAALIDELLVEELPPRKQRELHEHLAACPACQARYNRVVLASRLLEGGPRALTVPSEGELARVRARVLERVRLVPDQAPARRLALLRWAGVLAASAAVFAIVLPLALHYLGSPPSATRGAEPGGASEMAAELQPRGGQLPGQDKLAARVGLRAFCVRKPAGGKPSVVTSMVPAEGPGERADCGLGDILKFVYTNRSPLPYLFLCGVDEKRQVKWYEPHPPARASVAVKRDAVDEPLARAVRIGVNHGKGQLRLFAIFSERPLAAAQVEAAVARARVAKTPLVKLDSLAPLAGAGAIEQRSLLLRLVP